MDGTFRLGRVAGIPIEIHYTWLFAFFLVAGTLAAGPFNEGALGRTPYLPWLLGGVAAIGLFASVLVHELAHSFVALGFGMRVHSITLFIFGGVSQIASEAEEPKHEFLIAIVGPVTSFLIAGIFWGIREVTGIERTAAAAIVGYLALVNALLGVFNLLPGFPLDGGRVLRSIVWGASGSLVKATNVASFVGQALGWLMIIWGVSRIFGGDVIGGIWTGLIGWFLNNGAEASRRQAVIRDRYQRIAIADLIRPDVPTISAGTSVTDLVHEHLVRRGLRALPVIDPAGRVIGIVSISDVKELPAERWDTTSVEVIMTRDPLIVVSPDAGLADVLQLLDEKDVNQVLVVRDGRLVGLISRADVLRFMSIRDELGPRSLQVTRR
ncbi:MAG TPA: site-2 protease family protein [Dehalococcoidia bacterium]|nr:site-2 protease family protein [Dehalococcoidia bacterium]